MSYSGTPSGNTPIDSTQSKPRPKTPIHPELEGLVRARPVVLIFLPNTNELQRFVLSGAFAELVSRHQVHYVLPEQDAAKMLRAAPSIITLANSSTLKIEPERFQIWSEFFHSACVHFAPYVSSFAIRANIETEFDPKGFKRLSKGERETLRQDFDAKVDTLLQGIEPLPEILALFERHNPLYCVVPTSLLDLFCNDVVLACEAADVCCVLLQSGWDNVSSKGVLSRRSVFLGCWGPQSIEHAQTIQRLPASLLAPLGAPHYEFLKPASRKEVKLLRAELGVQEGERLLLFGGSFRQFDETSTLQRLDRAIAEGRMGPARVVYRPHPWRATRRHEDDFFKHEWTHVVFDPDMRDRYVREQSEAGYIKRNVPMFDMAYVSKLLSAVDAVISPMSTLLVESLILQKPTMAIAFGDGKHTHDPSVTARMTHFSEIARSGALVWCDSSEHFLEDCWRLVKKGRRLRLQEARQPLLDRIVTRQPGTYAERLADFCQAAVEPLGYKLRGRRANIKRGTISHAYGAHLIARDYCGVSDEHAMVPGYWMHGWIPEYHNVDPALIALHKKGDQPQGYDFDGQIREEKEETHQWVGRADQAGYLVAHGYRHVRAIGLPIVYLEPPDVPRVPGSLLVMPPHSHHTHGPDDAVAELYASQIADLKRKFEHVYVGLNEDDFANNDWVESFRRRGVDVLMTTDQSDPRTLTKLRRILSTFEYVTTNGFGSHVAMAAYCGARVSIYGPYADFPMERMRKTHAVRMFPQLLEQAYYLCTEEAMRKHYPFLFVEPDKATQRQEWGAREVGEQCRLTRKELRRAFGWPSPPQAKTDRKSKQIAVGALQTVSGNGSGDHRPLVLIAMSHAGFLRNFGSLIVRLMAANLRVHVHLSKEHASIEPDHHEIVDLETIGGLTFARDVPSRETWTVDLLRMTRDMIQYSRPQYKGAPDLRRRFPQLQKRHVLSERRQRTLRRAINRTPGIAKVAIESLLRKADELIAPHPSAIEVIDALDPAYLVVTPLVNFASREVDLVKAARRRGVPTLLAVASWDNLTNKGRIKIQTDRVAVWNQSMAREATDLHGIPSTRMWVTGAPVFDAWFDQAPSRDRETFCRVLGFDPERPIVVYLCSSESIAGTDEMRITKAWCNALVTTDVPNLKGINLLIRPHPMALKGWQKVRTEGSQLAADVASRWGAKIWPVHPTHPVTSDSRAAFFDTLYHSDAVVGLNTSAMIEAAILGKPVLTFLGHDRVHSQTGNLHFRHLAGGGFMFQAPDLPEHVRQLSAALADRLGMAEACRRFVDTFVRPFGRDTPASAKLVEFILGDLGSAAQGNGRGV